ncbi:MAG: hypothetical protein KC441_18375, partial [Anaerolineales bacterium]|nr:hypothetical protein [Anaerolineales bacterium]
EQNAIALGVQKRPFFMYNILMSAINQEEMQTAVHTALVNWGKLSEDGLDPLANLLLLQNHSHPDESKLPFALNRAIDRLLLENLDLLAEQDEIGTRVLQSRFLDGKITREVAQEMYASPDQVNRWQRAALTHLTQIIYSQEMSLRTELKQKIEGRLPTAPYSQFFGFTQARQALQGQLLQSGAPWIIVITGIGGIGKTSLADAIVRDILPSLTYRELCWLRVNDHQMSGEPLPPELAYEAALSTLANQLWPESSQGEPITHLENRLRQALKAAPHLIIIDNLETTGQIELFTNKLAALAEPSRFLLTSRARPSGKMAVYTHSLQELPLDDAESLLRHHAAIIGLTELATADAQTIASIYQVTGGSPLALRLVVSLTAVLPLPQILNDLSQSQLGPVEELYRHIYWQAWRTLTPPAQSLLQAMPLVAASGALPEQMQAISNLEASDFWSAVRELTARSLLEVRGTIQERRYGIHRLTEAFLNTEIIRWTEM